MGHQVYCAICGAPVLAESSRIWLGIATLLTSAHYTEEGVELDSYLPCRLSNPSLGYYLDLKSSHSGEVQKILRLDARTEDGYGRFLLTGSGEQAVAYRVDSTLFQRPGPAEGGSPLYIPVHGHCIQVADQFIAWSSSRKSNTERSLDCIDSIQTLWRVLHLRIDVDPNQTNPLSSEPHEFYGGRSCRGKDWDPYNGPTDHGFMMEQDPIDVPNLTESILLNLEPCPATVTDLIQDSGARDSHGEANQELRDVDLRCNYSDSPEWWCDAFVNSKTFPWLWDLDLDAVGAKRREGNWDWELLVRQLSQTNIHEPGDEVMKLPLSLRNRRRIWRVLEEARVGDLNEEKMKHATEREKKREAEKTSSEKSGTGKKPRLVEWPEGPPGFRFKVVEDESDP